jgi:flagellar protein FlgJ
MEIPGLYNSELQNFVNESQRKQASFEGFQATLERAFERGDAEAAELREACEAFESYFLQILFREMRKTTFADEGGFFAKSYAEKIFIDMLDEEISKNMAKSGGIGLAEQMLRQMTATAYSSYTAE